MVHGIAAPGLSLRPYLMVPQNQFWEGINKASSPQFLRLAAGAAVDFLVGKRPFCSMARVLKGDRL